MPKRLPAEKVGVGLFWGEEAGNERFAPSHSISPGLRAFLLSTSPKRTTLVEDTRFSVPASRAGPGISHLAGQTYQLAYLSAQTLSSGRSLGFGLRNNYLPSTHGFSGNPSSLSGRASRAARRHPLESPLRPQLGRTSAHRPWST